MIRLLLVDDHEVVREGLVALLDSAPDLLVVGSATGVEEALALLTAEPVPAGPDLVITDLRMPSVDGLGLLRRLAQEHPRLPVLVLSAFARPGDVAAARDAGARGYLVKDVQRQDLFDAVRVVAAGGTVWGPVAAAAMGDGSRGEVPTTREREILRLVAAGRTNDGIARDLRISQATVKTHLAHVYAKLGTVDRASTIATAIGRGWLDVDDAFP